MHVLIDFFHNHLYLLASLYFGSVWILVYSLSAKRSKAIMLAIGAGFAFITPFVAQICLSDWWHPEYLFRLGIFTLEDSLFGFAISGIPSGIYLYLKSLVTNSLKKDLGAMAKVLFLVITLLLIFGLYFWVGLQSFYSTAIAMILMISLATYLCPKMIWPMTITGITLLMIALPGYAVATILRPEWVGELWILTGLPSTLIIGIPVAEFAYYLLSGMSTSALVQIIYEDSI